MLYQRRQQQLELAFTALAGRAQWPARGVAGRGEWLARFAEQPFAAVDGDKQLLGLGHALGAAQKQIAILGQAKIKGLQHLGLQRCVKIDQHIAAGHQIQPQERRVRHQVMAGEHDHVAQMLAHLIRVIDRAEVPFQLVGRHFRQGRSRINAAPGNGQRFVVHVSGKNLHTILR